jgi:hypothetical protein
LMTWLIGPASSRVSTRAPHQPAQQVRIQMWQRLVRSPLGARPVGDLERLRIDQRLMRLTIDVVEIQRTATLTAPPNTPRWTGRWSTVRTPTDVPADRRRACSGRRGRKSPRLPPRDPRPAGRFLSLAAGTLPASPGANSVFRRLAGTGRWLARRCFGMSRPQRRHRARGERSRGCGPAVPGRAARRRSAVAG